jgi:hypothetical protein
VPDVPELQMVRILKTDLEVVTPVWLLVSLMLAPCRANGQDIVERARPSVSEVAGRQNLISAFRAAVRSGQSDIELGLIATLGEAVTADALAIAADPAEERGMRIAAIKVLSYARPTSAISVLQTIIDREPSRHDFLVWYEALTALVRFPHPELAEYWRRLFDHPVADVRFHAMWGLSWTGSLSDTVLLARLGGSTSLIGHRDRALAFLKTPRAERRSIIFAEPMSTAGSFVPAPQWVEQARPYLCSSQRLAC